MTLIPFCVTVYFGIGACYALWLAFGVERTRGPQNFLALLVVWTGSIVWWPLIAADFLWTAWKRVRGG
jgi:hypothetical protein